MGTSFETGSIQSKLVSNSHFLLPLSHRCGNYRYVPSYLVHGEFCVHAYILYFDHIHRSVTLFYFPSP